MSREQRFSHCPLCSQSRAQCSYLKHSAQQRQLLCNNAYLVHAHWFFFSPTLIPELRGTPGVLTVPPFYTGRAGRWANQDDAARAALLLVWLVWRNCHTFHVLPIPQRSSTQHTQYTPMRHFLQSIDNIVFIKQSKSFECMAQQTMGSCPLNRQLVLGGKGKN